MVGPPAIATRYDPLTSRQSRLPPSQAPQCATALPTADHRRRRRRRRRRRCRRHPHPHHQSRTVVKRGIKSPSA